MKIRLTLDNLEDFALLLFLCAEHAHKTGVGFDALFVRISFILYAGFILLRLLSRHVLQINNYFKWQLLFFGYVLLSCLWADPNYAYQYFTNFLKIFVLVLGMSNRVNDFKTCEKYIRIYYIALIYTVICLIVKTPLSDWGTINFGDALGMWKNTPGLYAATGAMLGLYFTFASKKTSYKILNIVATIICALIALVSGSRKALFMLPIGLIMYLFLYEKRRLDINSIIKVLTSLLLACLAIYAGYRLIMSNEILYSAVGRRIVSMNDVLFNNGSEASMDERSYYIVKARELFLQGKNIIFGAGSNGFAAYMDEIGYSHVAYCHNNFWELLSTLGIVGFSIFYWMHLKCAVNLFPMRMDMQEHRPLSAVLWTVLVINIVFGWWYVYYMQVSNNFLFILIFIFIYIVRNEYSIKATN